MNKNIFLISLGLMMIETNFSSLLCLFSSSQSPNLEFNLNVEIIYSRFCSALKRKNIFKIYALHM